MAALVCLDLSGDMRDDSYQFPEPSGYLTDLCDLELSSHLTLTTQAGNFSGSGKTAEGTGGGGHPQRTSSSTLLLFAKND